MHKRERERERGVCCTSCPFWSIRSLSLSQLLSTPQSKGHKEDRSITNIPFSQKGPIIEMQPIHEQNNLIHRDTLLHGHLGSELLNCIVGMNQHRYQPSCQCLDMNLIETKQQ